MQFRAVRTVYYSTKRDSTVCLVKITPHGCQILKIHPKSYIYIEPSCQNTLIPTNEILFCQAVEDGALV